MIKKVVATAAAAGSLVLAGAGLAVAESGAAAGGAAVGSPGVGSGNALQAPVSVPTNVCSNTVDAFALLNPAFGGACHNA